MNQAIRNSWVAAIAMFALIFGAISYVQVVGADDLKGNPLNQRAILQNYCNDRGAIIVGGEPMAESVEGTSEVCQFQRTYAQPALYAGLTGYFSRNYGATGLEVAMNDQLAGSSDQQFLDRIGQLFLGNQPKGASVELTIDPEIQKLAYDLIPDGQRGSIVVTNPKTGDILAMVSKPSYDPNLIATQDRRRRRPANIQRADQGSRDQPEPERQRPHGRAARSGLGLQARGYRGGPGLREVQRGQRAPQSGRDVLPGDPVQTAELRRRQLLHAEQGQLCLRAPAILQHAVRQHCPRPRPRAPSPSRQPSSAAARNSATSSSSTTPGAAFPEDLDEAGLAQSAIGQRDVRATPLQIALDDLGHRQRRSPDGSQPDQDRAVPGPARARRTPALGAADLHHPGNCPARSPNG